MPRRDYYNILGVHKAAGDDEIKRAYRTMAMKWHPDRNPEDHEAAVRFKEVSEAYEILSDRDQRARYDQLGPLFTYNGRPPSPEQVGEALGTVFAGLFPGRRKPKGLDINGELSVSLEEVATGTARVLDVQRQLRCSSCSGQGAQQQDQQTCDTCSGSGRARGPRLFRSKCAQCDGLGFTFSVSCTQCKGAGLYIVTEKIRLQVPAGIEHSQQLRVRGKGHFQRASPTAGDLLVTVHVKQHSWFTRHGQDVHLELPISYGEAMFGASIQVPTPTGTTTANIPAHTADGVVLTLKQHGLPKFKANGRGNLVLKLRLELAVLQPTQASDLKAWLSTLSQDCHPSRQRFRNWVTTKK